MDSLKNNINHKISLSIVTGFLGSGKTTLLYNYTKRLLNSNENVKIIINEYGDTDFNSRLEQSNVNIYSILNGCVCCDLKQELLAKLKYLINQNDTQHIIIEATGIAHPIDIIVACQDPDIVYYIKQPMVIGVADAPRFIQRAQYTNETMELMEAQLSVCDVILLNKMDLVNEDKAQLTTALSSINAAASVHFTEYANIEELTFESVGQHSNMHTSYHGHHHGIERLHYKFTSPIDRQLFYQYILRLPDNVLRLKGYVKFRDEPEVTYEFQYAYGLPDFFVIEEDKPLNVVLIGEQLDKVRLRNDLEMLQFT